MSQPTLIARILPKASKAILGKDKSKARISMARLFDAWPEIVAPEDPAIIRPVRISWKKLPDETSEGTLHIAAPSAFAARVGYQEAVIIGRINRLFGLPARGCLKRMAVIHDRLAPPQGPKTSSKPVANLPADLKATVDSVDDPVLRARLEGLAKAMASRDIG